MKIEEPTVAVVGACGGAGATRLTVEAAATLARAGRSVAVLDVVVATQGLAGHVPGRIAPDLTRVLCDDEHALADALVNLRLDLPGRVAVAPVRAPFERFARSQAADAARSLPELLAGAAGRFDHVLVDAGSVATNLSVAAVTAADRVAVVAPPDERGVDAVQRVRGRLADVGAPAPLVITNEGAGVGDGDRIVSGEFDADGVVPESDVRAPAEIPAVTVPDPTFAPAVADATATMTATELDLSFPDGGLLDGVT